MITFDWSTKPSLNTQAMAYGTMFPNVRKGDIMTFVIRTSQYKATVRVTSKVDFYANRLYTFPLDLSNLVANTTIEKNNATSGGSGDIEGTLSELGTFTVATFNVDGLPDISYIVDSTNPNGPGASGTTTMANRIASENPQWDIIGFSEDFANHSQLTAGLSSAYTFGTYRGSVSEAQLVSTADTDGLGFATRNTACSFSNEKIVEFTSSHGGLTSGANTCIKKGFRHYIVTLADGTAIDVLITHMNTYSGSGTDHINAQHAQLRQIALYVNSIRDNKRPIIFMGDTNCRYTRHDFQTYFWNVLDKDLIVNDPWVEFLWAGVYPQYPSKSYMVEDATGTDPAYDIIYEGHQKGEVVDKVIYINNPDAPIHIIANSYLRSYDNYKGLGDHMPIVVNFSYGKIATTSASTVVGVDSWDEELDLL